MANPGTRLHGAAEPTPDQISSTAPKDEPLAISVARQLREDIIRGALKPGERIVQDAIARRYGTSRIPVREALRELASEGLVAMEQDVGARVVSMDRDDLLEVYLMREALEPVAVRESAATMSAETIEVLRRILEESEAQATAGNVDRYLELDRRFHDAIAGVAPRRRLHRTIEGLRNAALQYVRLYIVLPPEKLDISVSEHRLILDALERTAAEDAAMLVRIHVRRTMLSLMTHGSLFDQPGAETGDPEPSS